MKTRPLEDAALVASLLLTSLSAFGASSAPGTPHPTVSCTPENPAARKPS